MNSPDPPDIRVTLVSAGRLRDSRRWVLGLIFGVSLFLGWPFLWTSRAFSPWEKVAFTLLNLVWAVLVFWGFYLTMSWSAGRLGYSL